MIAPHSFYHGDLASAERRRPTSPRQRYACVTTQQPFADVQCKFVQLKPTGQLGTAELPSQATTNAAKHGLYGEARVYDLETMRILVGHPELDGQRPEIICRNVELDNPPVAENPRERTFASADDLRRAFRHRPIVCHAPIDFELKAART